MRDYLSIIGDGKGDLMFFGLGEIGAGEGGGGDGGGGDGGGGDGGGGEAVEFVTQLPYGDEDSQIQLALELHEVELV